MAARCQVVTCCAIERDHPYPCRSRTRTFGLPIRILLPQLYHPLLDSQPRFAADWGVANGSRAALLRSIEVFVEKREQALPGIFG